MKIKHTLHRMLLAVVTSLIVDTCAFGQGLQLSPGDAYDSIPTPSTTAIEPVASAARGLADAGGGTSVRGTAPVTQPGRPVGEPPKDERNGDLRSADLTRFLPPVRRQAKDGDCVAWALAYASYSCQICQSRNRTDPSADWEIFSPAFISSQLKANEKGLIPSDAVNLLKKEGCASLVTMPLDKSVPTATAKVEAAAFRPLLHERARGLNDLRGYLDEGFPVVLIVQLDEGFISKSPSAEPYKWSQKKSKNFHAVTAVGYDDQKKAVKIMNSWGTEWKDKGFCWVSYDSLKSIDSSNWCAEAHVVKVKAPNPVTVETPETARTDSRSFLLKADHKVYEKIAGKDRLLSPETHPKIIDIVCDDSDLFVLRQDRKVDLMQDPGAGSDVSLRKWLHLNYGPMADETASMLSATSDSTLYILTSDGDVIEYHERNSENGELVRINPPINDKSTVIDVRILGNLLRATTTSGKVVVHDIHDTRGRWTTADAQSK